VQLEKLLIEKLNVTLIYDTKKQEI